MDVQMLEDAWWCVYIDILPLELCWLWGILVRVLLMSPIYQLSITSPYNSQSDMLLIDCLKESLTKYKKGC